MPRNFAGHSFVIDENQLLENSIILLYHLIASKVICY